MSKELGESQELERFLVTFLTNLGGSGDPHGKAVQAYKS